MPITHEGLAREFEFVTNPGEQKHISEAIDVDAVVIEFQHFLAHT